MNKLNVLYEDNHLIIVEKEPNILSQKDSTGDIDITDIIKKYLKEKYNKPGNVYLGLLHRLDRPVGGIMVFAKTSKAAKRMSEQIKKHQLKKYYLAVVHGKVENEAELKDYLERDSKGNTKVTTKEKGKEAVLHYQLKEYNKEKNISLVKIELKTGRHHQIRVQFSSRNHPLCGDQRYGKSDKTQIALYAYKLEFTHPVTKEKIIICNLPKKEEYWSYFTM